MTGRQLAIWLVVATTGCLETIEPTPNPAPLTITPLVEATTVVKQGDGFAYSLPLVVKNVGTRPVYVDVFYRRTEKLVNQKWQVAAESAPTIFLRQFAPNESRRIEYVVWYKPGAGNRLLEQVRGLYRVGLRAFYAADQTDPVSSTPSYSKSFVLVEPED